MYIVQTLNMIDWDAAPQMMTLGELERLQKIAAAATLPH